MSTLWTPDGERPVTRPGAGASSPTFAGSQRPSPAIDDFDDGDIDDELDQQMAAMQAELADAPAADVIANHCIGLFQLAALHLSQRPPKLDEATLAIDAMGAVVDKLKGRLGENEATLVDGLAQIRLAFVQIKGGLS